MNSLTFPNEPMIKPAKIDPASGLPQLRELYFGRTDDAAIRLAALKLMAQIKSRAAFELLVEFFEREKEAQLLDQILVVLADYSYPKMVRPITDRLMIEKDGKLRQAMTQVLAGVSRKDLVLAEIPKLLEHGYLEPEVIELLSQIGTAAEVPLLEQLFENTDDQQIKQQILKALSQIDHPASWQKLDQYYHHAGEPELRRMAFYNLIAHRQPPTADFLVHHFTHNSDAGIRRAIIYKLIESPDPQSLEPIIDQILEENNLELLDDLALNLDPDETLIVKLLPILSLGKAEGKLAFINKIKSKAKDNPEIDKALQTAISFETDPAVLAALRSVKS